MALFGHIPPDGECIMPFSLKRVAGVLAIAGALSLATFAYTNTNTVAPSAAGAGSGAISGYDITDVHYVLGETDPADVASVTFTMDPAPAAGATVTIRLADAGPWYSCTVSVASADCDTTGATVAGATNLTVVAAD